MTTGSNLKILRINLSMLIVLLLCSFTHGKIIHVDDDAAGNNDGSSWTDAYPCLQNALTSAQPGDEIRVAQGTYKPDREVPPGQDGSVAASGDRSATFQLIDGVDIKGGYAGYSDPDPNEREISLYETILSGDLNGDDNDVNDPCNLLTEPTRSENSYQVVTGYNVNCILEGFIISGGNANGSSESGFGGGMNIQLSSVTITNCIFRNNATRHDGAALSSYSGSGPILNNCIFAWNSSGSMVNVGSRLQFFEGGGGMYSNDNSPTLTNCTFIENVAPIGGGIYNLDSNMTLTNCTFNGNHALFFGGGMYTSDCNATLTDCVFTSNSSERRGGGGMENWDSNITLTNCTFGENFAVGSGGALNNSANCNITLIDCLLRDNFANGSGGAINNYSNDPMLNNCTFSENSTLGSGGAMYNVKANAMLTNCSFSGNLAENNGGGIYNASDSNSTLTNCMFSGNKAESKGGGTYNYNSNPTLINCVFSGNTAANWGGGINNSNSIVGLTNCTFTENSAEIGSSLACDSSNQESPSILELINCIIWDGDNEIWNNDGSIIFIEHSDVQGGWSGEGEFNIDADPLFVDAEGADNATGTEDDDLHLLPDSPCIDAGENSAIPEAVVTDAGGNPRIVNNTVDIGAYEFSIRLIPEEIKYGGGTGEPNDPYLIYTAEQLNTIALNQEDADKHFKLMADIDLSAYQGDSFNRIGFYEPPEYFPSWHPPFEGVFDGNNHTISNFTYVIDVNKPMKEGGLWGDEYIGLFGVVSGEQAQIKNLGLINPEIDPAITCTERVTSVGAIAGELGLGSITNCYVEGGKISGDLSVGGLVGSNEGTISNCYTTCDVTWAKGRWLRPLDLPYELNAGSFGGLVGFNRGQISDCYTTGSIQGYNSSGGLIGHNYRDMFDTDLDHGVISNCYETGDVSGNEYVGGLAGENSGKIDRCLAVGNVSGLNKVGGLVGNMIMEEGSISHSYSISNVSGNEQIGGLVGYSNGSIQQCFAVSEVLGTVYVGGLVGFNGFGTIHYSYSWGSVKGSEDVGALSGRNGSGTINCCYAANTVNTASKSENVGGLLGGNVSGIVSECFWNIETSGLLDMCGFQGSSANGCNNTYGKTTIEMQTADTFLDAGWDFVDEGANGTEDIWLILEGQGYPRLSWEPQKYSGGTGEPNDPYWVIRAEDLLLFGNSPEDYNKHFRLMSNIDLLKYPYDMALIAPDMNTTQSGFQGTPFSGVFDGNGHTIWNLTVNGENYLGLFGYISGENAKIVDLGLLVPKINAGTGGFAGSLVGHNEGTITNCYVTMGIVSGQGGLAGENYGTITKCYFTGNVSGISGVGGLVGLNGWLDGSGMISDCYAKGSASGNNIVGGLVGRNESTIMNCYTTSKISGNEPVGGLVGANESGGTIVGSFWDIEISGLTTSADGESKTTAEMQMTNTFLEAGWDFVDETANGTEDTWWINEGKDYPRLWWEAE
jgi:parallel beta-helix repeat protein